MSNVTFLRLTITKKEKNAIFACLQEFYATTTIFPEEHIFSDGSGSEFKNKYMMKLIHTLGKRHSIQEFHWNYFATGHGTGIVDGIGGEAKSLLRQQVLIKFKNVVVQCASDFAKAVKDAMPGVTVHLMTEHHLNSIEDIWGQAKEVKGIYSSHKAVLKDGKLTIYANARSEKPVNTVLYEQQPQQGASIEQPVNKIKVGDFVKMIHGDYKGFYAVVTG